MLSPQFQALINSFAWPLLDYKALATDWKGDWKKHHDAFLQVHFPQLGRDEIAQIRCLAWEPDANPPTPRDAVRKLTKLFTEIRGGKVLLKSRPYSHLEQACALYAKNHGQTWSIVEGFSNGWLYASRLVQPTMIWAWQCSGNDLLGSASTATIDSGFNQLETLWRSDMGDYHVHQSAAVSQDHFFPLLPLQPDCWDGLQKCYTENFANLWTPVDLGVFDNAESINFFLLVLAHGGLAWLLLRNKGAIECLRPTALDEYWKLIIELLRVEKPKDKWDGMEKAKAEIYWKLQLIEQKTRQLAVTEKGDLQWVNLAIPDPWERDCWVDGVALCRMWKDLQACQEIKDGSSHALLFDRMLWLHNFIYRLFAQPVGTPGFAQFKIWFTRSGYSGSLLDFMRPEEKYDNERNRLQENIEAVNSNGRVQRLEFRANFDDEDKIRRIVDQFLRYVGKNEKHTQIVFSQQLIKDEDKYMPDGVCRMDPKGKKEGGQKITRHRDLIRNYVKRVSNTVQFAERHPEILLLVRGLDVVNYERRTPNWVPGLAFLFYNDHIEKAYQIAAKSCWVPPPYRHVFHAGEDFWLPSDGLRAVFEPVYFGILRRDDRIGHALVLGLDLSTWSGRSETRVTRLGVLLDDLVWEWKLMRTGAITGEIVPVEEEIVQTLGKMREFLGDYSHLHHLDAMGNVEFLWQAYALRYDYHRLQQVGLVGGLAADSWFADDRYSEMKERLDQAKFCEWDGQGNSSYGSQDPFCLYHEYLDSEDLWRAWEQGCMVTVDEKRVARWKKLQEYVLDLVVQSGIVVESCPSSNVLISGVNSYANHSIFQLAPPDGTSKLLVCLNTDDPITFSPNICEEYQRLYQAAIEKGLSPPEALRWLEGIKKMGINASFLPNDVDYPDRYKRLREINRLGL
ncbi:MAG: hypothetical protein HQL79_11750 [Magnetococcales bacterium]|nr:hypothetical protein [Magnetococcales bacterium]